MEQYKKLSKKKRLDRKDIIFYIMLLAWPVAQFSIFYIAVNFQSLLFSIQKIDIVNNTIQYTFENFTNAFKAMTESYELVNAAKMSLLSFLLINGIGIPMGLIFSYYIYKKMYGSGAFRVILFLPSIISGIVMATIYQFFVERAVPTYFMDLFGKEILGLMENESSRFSTIIFFNIWIGFGTSILLYANGMSGVSSEVVESAKLDGAGAFSEFWHIVLPSIYSTISTFLVTGLAGIFGNQIGLFSFYGHGAPENLRTYGYILYTKTQLATSQADYPYLSAIGIMLTLIIVPTTLLLRRLLEKMGPSEE